MAFLNIGHKKTNGVGSYINGSLWHVQIIARRQAVLLIYLYMYRILVVEDKESMAMMLRETLESEGYEVVVAMDGAEGIKMLRQGTSHLVLTDLKLPKKNGIEVLKASRDENPLRPVVVMTAFGTVENAVEAMKQGAFDFITKPFNVDHLLLLLKRALENQRLATENILMKEEGGRHGMPSIIGKSPALQDVARKIQKVAPTRTTVLLTGESGTGKELFARALHYLSDRADYPFVPINCAAIPSGLVESELFGHEKGAFTGADSRKLGKFELANGGTIFLDEIGELPSDIQAKLLRVLQEGEFSRVGGTSTITSDVRIVAASNKDLEKAMREGTFREDLFFRLSVFPVRVPPLSERREDIAPLAEFFLTKYIDELKTDAKSIAPEAMTLLTSYGWKGNVRELENAIERATILCDGDVIMPEHLSLRAGISDASVPIESPNGTLEEVSKAAVRLAESARIRKALETTGGNKTKAAALLEVSYKTLLTKIKDYKL